MQTDPVAIFGQRTQWLLVCLFYAATACNGAMSLVQQTATQELFLLHSILLPIYQASLGATWLWLDTRRFSYFIPNGWYMVVLACIALVLPLWLIWTRGFRGVGWCLVHLIGTTAASMAGYHLMGILYYGSNAWLAQFGG